MNPKKELCEQSEYIRSISLLPNWVNTCGEREVTVVRQKLFVFQIVDDLGKRQDRLHIVRS